MFKKIIILVFVGVCLFGTGMRAQSGRGDARRGNRQFSREKWTESDISYRKALARDSMSFAHNYNIADNLYRQGSMEEAGKHMDKAIELSGAQKRAGDAFYNRGDIAIASKDWQTAVDVLKKAMLADPDDMEAKENYTYAKKMLENGGNGGGGGQNQDNQDQNRNDQDQNGGQGDQNKDQNKDQNNDQNDQDKDQNQNDRNRNQDQNQDSGEGDAPQISSRQARQMLDAIEAREKETRDKVEKEKAALLKSRKLDKNW